MRLLLDENFNHQILNGLKLRIPNLDYVIAQGTALRGVTDPDLLEWAAVEDRLIVTHDIKMSFAKTSSAFSFNNMGKPDITC